MEDILDVTNSIYENVTTSNYCVAKIPGSRRPLLTPHSAIRPPSVFSTNLSHSDTRTTSKYFFWKHPEHFSRSKSDRESKLGTIPIKSFRTGFSNDTFPTYYLYRHNAIALRSTRRRIKKNIFKVRVQ